MAAGLFRGLWTAESKMQAMLCSESFRICEDSPCSSAEEEEEGERLRKYDRHSQAVGKLDSMGAATSMHWGSPKPVVCMGQVGWGSWTQFLQVPARLDTKGADREFRLIWCLQPPAQDHSGRSHRTLQVEHCRNMLNCSSSGTPSTRKVWPSASFHGSEAEA